MIVLLVLVRVSLIDSEFFPCDSMYMKSKAKVTDLDIFVSSELVGFKDSIFIGRHPRKTYAISL